LLVQAQREVGIPTWQDITNLENAPLEDELRRALNDPDTANAVWLMTPEVADSVVVRDIEFPGCLQRHRVGDGFFIKPIATGGLDYDDVNRLTPSCMVEDLRNWNLTREAPSA